MTTIKDIAKLANVSTATVSRIINGSGKVKHETRLKVEKIIKETNYHPNQVARSLYQKKSKMIGVIVPDLSNTFYAKIIDGIQNILQPSGFSILISFSVGSNESKYLEFINEFQQNNIDGIISSAFTSKERFDLPFVMYDSANINDKYIRIVSDNITGGKGCVDLLHGTINKVIIQHLSLDLPTVQERVSAIIKQLNYRKITYKLVEVNEENIADSAKSIINQISKHDAVIAVNDIYAAQIIQEAHKKGITIPKDFQLVGYDNNSLSQYTFPTISTIDQQPFLIGQTAAKRLLGLINGNTSKNNSIIDVDVIQRCSTNSTRLNKN